MCEDIKYNPGPAHFLRHISKTLLDFGFSFLNENRWLNHTQTCWFDLLRELSSDTLKQTFRRIFFLLPNPRIMKMLK